MMSKALLDSKISISEKVAELPIGGQLLYTWMIPHSDDLGFIQGSTRTIKAKVIPMLEATEATIDTWIEQMIKLNLIKDIEYGGKKFYLITGYLENQKLRRDIQPQTILPFKYEKDAKKNWQRLEEIYEKMHKGETPRTVGVTSTERDVPSANGFGTEVKLSKDKLINNSKAVVKKKTQNEEDQPPRSETS